MADRPAVLAFFHNIVAGREAEFEEWFQHEHLPERIAIQGFLMGRRYEAVSADRSYFHFYVIRSVEDLKSDAYIARVNEPTPLTRTVMSEIYKERVSDCLSPHLPAGRHARCGRGNSPAYRPLNRS